MKNETSTEETKPEPAYPLGRWSSVEAEVQILRLIVNTEEVRRLAVEKLVEQAKAALPIVTIIRRAA